MKTQIEIKELEKENKLLLLALQAQAAISDLPPKLGEKELIRLSWDGNEDINIFVNKLRQTALKRYNT